MTALDDARAAVAFLTRLPAWRRATGSDSGLAGAAGYFPLVGLLVAGMGIGVWAAVEPLLGPLVAAVASVLATVVVTGALHEDGLADVADGFWAGTSPRQRLEIMRDSRIGTFGVLAVAGDVLLRAALLASLDLAGVARVLVAGHVIGRAAPLVLGAWLLPARADGLGLRLGKPRRGGVTLAAVTVVASAVVTAEAWAFVPLLAAGVAVTAMGWSARRRIGGYTGDVLGAGVLVVNLAVAAAVVALIRAGWI
jgi:adenosylcobinamide-GDP ribazoletransferase